MGHVVNYGVYEENVDKGRVQEEWDMVVRYEDYQEGASGLPNPIRWLDKVFFSREEAENYIENNDSGWYDQIAVKFKEVSDFKPSKTYEKLMERRVAAIQKVTEIDDDFYFKEFKSKMLGCRHCESKINLRYLKGNYCPVCKKDMRPSVFLQKIEKAKENAKKAEENLKTERKKLENKQLENAKTKWLVKVEYHV